MNKLIVRKKHITVTRKHLLMSFAFSEAECIYQDQIDDQMLRRPDGRPDGSWATRSLQVTWLLLGDQIADQISNELLPFGQISGPLK